MALFAVLTPRSPRWLRAPAGAGVGQWLQSFKEFPPRQKPGSFNLDRVMEAVMSNTGKQ